MNKPKSFGQLWVGSVRGQKDYYQGCPAIGTANGLGKTYTLIEAKRLYVWLGKASKWLEKAE